MSLRDVDLVQIRACRGAANFTMKRGSFRYEDRRGGETVLTEVGGKLMDGRGRCLGSLDIYRDEEGQEMRIRVRLREEGYNRAILTFRTDLWEHYYGCGETFSDFDLRGQKVRIWVAEHQNAARIGRKILGWTFLGPRPRHRLPFSEYESYYAQPTFVSSGKWFMHVDTTSFVSFDFRRHGEITVEIWGDGELRLAGASSFEELSGKQRALFGSIPALPEWCLHGITLGIQKGRDVVEEKIGRALAAGVQVNGVWCQDWCGCRRTGFGYQVMWNWEADPALYPDLPAWIESLRERGIRFLGYINPFLAIEKDLYREAHEKGYLVKDRAGADYLVTITTFPAAMIDLTNPAAWEWYKQLIRRNMIDIGMGGWMADFGEYLPTDCVLFDGSDPMERHNEWPVLWAKLNREAVEEAGKLGEVIFFTRAGSTGTIGSTLLMWNGDQHVDWSLDDGLPSVIPATLSLAMSGCGLVHSDVGGYTTIRRMRRERELLLRWEELCAFSPYMRSHEGNQPDRSVQFDVDTEALAHLARCTAMHERLAGYLRRCMEQEEDLGIPVMRPLFYHYGDEWAKEVRDEYLLGRDILVAPVLEKGAVKRKVRLTEDEWVHLFTGERYGAGEYEVESPMGRPPVFVRAEAFEREFGGKIWE